MQGNLIDTSWEDIDGNTLSITESGIEGSYFSRSTFVIVCMIADNKFGILIKTGINGWSTVVLLTGTVDGDTLTLVDNLDYVGFKINQSSPE